MFQIKRIFILLVFSAAFSWAWGQSNTEWAVSRLRALSPREYEVLKRYEKLPAKFSVRTQNGTLSSQKSVTLLEFMRGGSRTQCLGDISTNVHEINHALTSAYPYEYCRQHNRVFTERSMYYFFIGPDNDQMIFSNVDYFPSQDLKREIPAALRTFRFNTYIGGESSTQTDGLLGLLGEYNAYHHSLNTVWDMKAAWMTAADTPVDGYIDWMSALPSYVEAYYEFRFYILEYLRDAERNKPEIYRQIKKEAGLISVFNRITENFRTVVQAYEQENSSGWKTYWQAEGYEVRLSEEGDYCFIGKNGQFKGFNNQLGDRDKLLPRLKSDRYNKVIIDLGIVE